jgi:hypothetical protein
MRLQDGHYHFIGHDPAVGYDVIVQDGGATMLWGAEEIPLHYDEVQGGYYGEDGPERWPHVYPVPDHLYIFVEPGRADLGSWEDPQAII